MSTYPFNRDFDIPVDGLPFNWSLEATPGRISDCASIDGGKKRALLVEFSGARVDFANVKQLMLLPAGDYTFRGRVKTEELRTSRGLWWHIFCANNSAKTLANTELVSGATEWTDFTVKFQVPATDCRAQWLQLELPARIDPELRSKVRFGTRTCESSQLRPWPLTKPLKTLMLFCKQPACCGNATQIQIQIFTRKICLQRLAWRSRGRVSCGFRKGDGRCAVAFWQLGWHVC